MLMNKQQVVLQLQELRALICSVDNKFSDIRIVHHKIYDELGKMIQQSEKKK